MYSLVSCEISDTDTYEVFFAFCLIKYLVESTKIILHFIIIGCEIWKRHLPNCRLARSGFENRISSALSRVPTPCQSLRGWDASSNPGLGLTVARCSSSRALGRLSLLACEETCVSFPVAWLYCLGTSVSTLRILCMKALQTGGRNFSSQLCIVSRDAMLCPLLVKENQSRPWQPTSSVNDLEEQGPEWDDLRITLLAISM